MSQQIAVEKEVNVEALSDELEAALPQLIEGIEARADGQVIVNAREAATPEQLDRALAIIRAHVKTVPAWQKRMVNKADSERALASVDFAAIRTAVQAITNQQIRQGFIELLKLNYHLAAALGLITDKPEGIDQ